MDLPCELETTFRYRHGFGELLPYFEGLTHGRAMATHCGDCGQVWFAPRLQCTCSGRDMRWLQLAGTGRILAVTTSLSSLPLRSEVPVGDVGLIQLDGANNAVFGRIALTAATGAMPKQPSPGGRAAVGDKVRLCADSGHWQHPVQAALYVITTAQS